jgi:uncharacterized protein with LGFP repeats
VVARFAVAITVAVAAVAVAVVVVNAIRGPSVHCVAVGSGNLEYTTAFVAAYDHGGGRPVLGCAVIDVHGWGPGWIQDLRGSPRGNAAIMALSPEHAVVLAGTAWRDYQAVAGPDTGPRAGYPTSDPFRCGASIMFELADGTSGPGGMVTTGGSQEFVELTGAVWARYRDLGGPTGRLGSPTGEPTFDASGERQTFEHGWIFAAVGAATVVTDLEARGGVEAPTGLRCSPRSA